jgi:cob(I)alamin adenosyltransferase
MEMIMKIVSFVKLDRFNEKLDDVKALILAGSCKDVKTLNIARNIIVRSTPLNEQMAGWSDEEKNKIALAVYSNSNFRFVLN